MKNKGQFTVFTMVYYGLDLFKQAIESVIHQTYENLQIIIVNNGADEIITSYVNDLASSDKRIDVIRYEENIFSYDDPQLLEFVVFNDALKHTTGEWITFISYDDLMALDFVERMVKLFEENPACTTAMGRSVSMDIDGNVNQEELNNRKKMFRARHMPGHLLALATLENYQYTKGLMHWDPGQLFTIRCDVLRQYGGYHRALDFSQLYGIVPFGITGFDEDAIFYWRRHDGQLNKLLSNLGIVNSGNEFQMLKDFEIKKRWQVHGSDAANFVIKRFKAKRNQGSANWFAYFLWTLNIKALFRLLKETGHRLGFWYYVPMRLWNRRQFIKFGLFKLAKPAIKPVVKLILRINGRKDFSNKFLKKLHLKVNQ
jgi:glycosyltransferase involved in cell wall biosynthesis